MLDVKLDEIKLLITKAKKKSLKRPLYPNVVKDYVKGELTKQMSVMQIIEELELSRSFVCRIKNEMEEKPLANCPETKNPLQFMQIDDQYNCFVKDHLPQKTPIIRLSTTSGVTIEIFS
jgi:hypothetical protein